jgi:hypothetical protein
MAKRKIDISKIKVGDEIAVRLKVEYIDNHPDSPYTLQAEGKFWHNSIVVAHYPARKAKK